MAEGKGGEGVKPRAEVIGIYSIVAAEPTHLVEMRVVDSTGAFDIGHITQEVPGQARSEWQVPWLEAILNSSGNEILATDLSATQPEQWQGVVRFSFFFHYLDCKRPLITPFGTAQLPLESRLPPRLSILHYEQP